MINPDHTELIFNQKNTLFIDVRNNTNWDLYHIPDSQSVHLKELPNYLTDLPKDRRIVFVRQMGLQSAIARESSIQAGFTIVTSIDRGMSAWKKTGHRIEP